MRFVLAVAAVAATLAAATALPAGARVSAPGPQCGGTLWRLMTLSDTAKKSVTWAPTVTTIPDVAKLTAPAKITTARSTSFQKHVWSLSKTIIERYRMASNGEIVLELFDVNTQTYMNAYLEAPQCLPTTARGRGQMLTARNNFLSGCPAPTNDWQMLGATADMSGVGFFNPVRTTMGALKNGAELRPLVSMNITQGCGHFS
jgi:hypothetical protein